MSRKAKSNTKERDESASSSSSPSSRPVPPLEHLSGLLGPHDESIHPELHAQLSPEQQERLASSPGKGIQPGSLVNYDFRHLRNKAADAKKNASGQVKLVQWNIERSYKLSEIIALLKANDADIIALQEVDIGCERSGWLDTGREIAEALQMNYSFICEFQELYSIDRRDSHVQGGGVHGNAILSRFSHGNSPRIIEHRDHFVWERNGPLKREPRKGKRYTLAVEILVQEAMTASKSSSSPKGNLMVYTTHLEVFAGIFQRLENFAEIMMDIKQMDKEQQAAALTQEQRQDVESSSTPYQIIMGDFNTLSHSIARCSPAYSTDEMRWRSLGYTEAEWWVKYVLTVGSDTTRTQIEQNILSQYPHRLSAAHVSALLPNPGFYDPFDAYADSTLWNYKGWFQGKLDWMLLRNVSHVPMTCRLDNEDYHASDHKMMTCAITFDQPHTHSSAAAVSSSASTSTVRSRRRDDSGKQEDSNSSIDATAAFPAKTSEALRALMPLRRWRPGFLTSSSREPHIYLSQIATFWLFVFAVLYLISRAAN